MARDIEAGLRRQLVHRLMRLPSRGPDTLDPVIKAAIAHLWFVTIHPFDDGNRRIARAIADMALARADQTPQRFYSMSAQIQLERRQEGSPRPCAGQL